MKKNNDRLGLGARRGITVTVTETPQSLAELLEAASPGRTEMSNRRQLNLRDTDGSKTIYILETTSQTIVEGIQIRAGEERFYELSVTGTDNASLLLMNPADLLSKTYFAVAPGDTSAPMTVEESA